MLTEVGKRCYGFLPWRRSSLHLFIPDTAYQNYIFSILRKANPKILIFGEVYYGYTALEHPKVKWWYNVPKNCSGVILTNLGYTNINVEGVLYKLNQKFKNIPIIAQVLGQHPYYLTINKNNYSEKRNFALKELIGRRYVQAGAAGIITISDDGSNGLYDKNIVNNLAKRNNIFNK